MSRRIGSDTASSSAVMFGSVWLDTWPRESPVTRAVACILAARASAADAKAGQEVFAKSCKSCHGADGSGNPAIAKMMKVDMKNLGSAEVQAQSDGDIAKIITEGKGKMKPVKSVSGPAVDNVVAYVRTLKKVSVW